LAAYDTRCPDCGALAEIKKPIDDSVPPWKECGAELVVGITATPIHAKGTGWGTK